VRGDIVLLGSVDPGIWGDEGPSLLGRDYARLRSSRASHNSRHVRL